MGLLDSLLARWRSRKRSADDSNDSIENKDKKRPRTESYTLTPDSKNSSGASNKDCDYYYYGHRVSQTESRTYEFKAGGVLFGREINQFIQKYASAFFNSGGGVILAGVTDDGIIKGVGCSSSDKDRFHYIFSDELKKFRPNVSEGMWSIRYIPVLFNDQRPKSFFNTNNLYVMEIKFSKGILTPGRFSIWSTKTDGVEKIVIAKYKEAKSSQKKESTSDVVVLD